MLRSKLWRETLFNTMIQLAIEYVLIVIIVSMFEDDDVLLYGLGGIAILYVLRILNAIFSAIASTPVYYLSKSRSVSAIVAQFYEKGLPVKGSLAHLGASEYMEEIARSKDTPEPVRRFVDQTLGELSGFRLAGGMVPFLRLNAILDAAIERYVSEKNARGHTPADVNSAIKSDINDAAVEEEDLTAAEEMAEEIGKAARENGDEAEAAMSIQMKCQVGAMFAGRMYDPEEDFRDQSARYKQIRNECIGLADQIEDEFYRGVAVHRIIDMCVAAKDLVVAHALLVSVRDDFIREQIFETAPAVKAA